MANQGVFDFSAPLVRIRPRTRPLHLARLRAVFELQRRLHRQFGQQRDGLVVRSSNQNSIRQSTEDAEDSALGLEVGTIALDASERLDGHDDLAGFKFSSNRLGKSAKRLAGRRRRQEQQRITSNELAKKHIWPLPVQYRTGSSPRKRQLRHEQQLRMRLCHFKRHPFSLVSPMPPQQQQQQPDRKRKKRQKPGGVHNASNLGGQSAQPTARNDGQEGQQEIATGCPLWQCCSRLVPEPRKWCIVHDAPHSPLAADAVALARRIQTRRSHLARKIYQPDPSAVDASAVSVTSSRPFGSPASSSKSQLPSRSSTAGRPTPPQLATGMMATVSVEPTLSIAASTSADACDCPPVLTADTADSTPGETNSEVADRAGGSSSRYSCSSPRPSDQASSLRFSDAISMATGASLRPHRLRVSWNEEELSLGPESVGTPAGSEAATLVVD